MDVDCVRIYLQEFDPYKSMGVNGLYPRVLVIWPISLQCLSSLKGYGDNGKNGNLDEWRKENVAPILKENAKRTKQGTKGWSVLGAHRTSPLRSHFWVQKTELTDWVQSAWIYEKQSMSDQPVFCDRMIGFVDKGNTGYVI